MNTTVSIADMLDLDDGRKVLARYNKQFPGIVDNLKKAVLSKVKFDGIKNIDDMLDDTLLVIAALCAHNTKEYIDIDDTDYANDAATAALVQMLSAGITTIDACTTALNDSSRPDVPADLDRMMSMLAMAKLVDPIGKQVFNHAEGCVRVSGDVVNDMTLSLAKRDKRT